MLHEVRSIKYTFFCFKLDQEIGPLSGNAITEDISK